MSGSDYINRIIAAVGEEKVLCNEAMSRHTTFRPASRSAETS